MLALYLHQGTINHMQPSDLHTVADTIGIIVSIPLLTAMVGIIAFAFKVKGAAEDASRSIKAATEALTKILDDHEDRLRMTEGKVTVLWDGHERRKNG